MGWALLQPARCATIDGRKGRACVFDRENDDRWRGPGPVIQRHAGYDDEIRVEKLPAPIYGADSHAQKE